MTRKSDSAVQAQADFSTHVLSNSNDDADEYGQSFNLTQLRQDVSGLQAEVRSLRNRNININIYILSTICATGQTCSCMHSDNQGDKCF